MNSYRVVARLSFILLFLLFIGGGAIYLYINHIKDFDVDLVYLWCDGEEPAFAARKEKYLKEEGKISSVAAAPGRFISVDELKYSLRSVEKYAPWVHRIFIVTDRQIPEWLNTKHPKIVIVDHSKIIPKKYIPLFNSIAIESRLHMIHELSEHFLLANDDMFLNRPLEKSFFFPKKRMVNVRLKKTSVPKENCMDKDIYYAAVCNATTLMERDFGSIPPFSEKTLMRPHHSYDGYLKSDYKACAAHYNKEFEEMLSHRFRGKKDILRHIVSLYSFYFGHATLLVDEKHNTEITETVYFTNKSSERYYFSVLSKLDPASFCINDTALSSQEDRQRMKVFLEKYFPEKSKFEK